MASTTAVHSAVGPAGDERHSGPFGSRRTKRRYTLILALLIVLAAGSGIGLLAWGNPMPFGTEGFWIIARGRANLVLVMLVVAFAQAIATVSFQTAANNRIITPSIMGFESLYRAIQTSTVYLFGLTGLIAIQGIPQFLIQVALMVALAVALYSWLLSGKYGNLQIMLLVGIVIGGGLGSVSTFMQRLLTPSEFDVLAARMMGNLGNARDEYLPVAIPLVLIAGILLLLRTPRLNVLALGRDTAMNLGVDHRRELIRVLFLVSILMAVSTALVGPMTFFGFLVATLAYQFADTYDHKYIFPIAVLLGFTVLAGAYFIMRHVFYAYGIVSIIIELIGGSVFLIVILRKGRL
ncbi:MAG: iron chelate uptake ABC transporter family permease subunit [Ruaniaceae bacterium]|nr:iron chelate uptake ABC transporter family permease subunit [Ruaniaceae bacterium]